MKNVDLQGKVDEFVKGDLDNILKDGLFFFDAPLIGFCKVDDSLFAEMKKEKVIGTIFRDPEQWLPGAASVISYFLPISKEIRLSNYSSDNLSVKWLHCRFKGEQFNLKLRQFIVSEIEAIGGKAIAPALDKNNMMVDRNMFKSNWSERHIAYIAGLGTFGLNRGLITSKGMAGRFGSVITNLDFTPTARNYSDPFQFCLGIKDNKCRACMERCPAGAISNKGMEKKICRHYAHEVDPLKKVRERYGYSYSACGKCQTNVPCESEIPQ